MNELFALIKRALEGLGFCPADYEDAAAAIVWLESRGVNGLDTMVAALPQLAADVKSVLEFVSAYSRAEVLDGHGRSVLFCGNAVADLACAGASDDGPGRVELQHCRDRQAILPSLCTCASRGLNAIAHWQDNSSVHVALSEADKSHPEYLRMASQSQARSTTDTLVVICSTDRRSLSDIMSQLAGNGTGRSANHRLTSSDMQKHYRHSLLHGMDVDVDLVNRLAATADAVLVEASEQSRLGAGELTS